MSGEQTEPAAGDAGGPGLEPGTVFAGLTVEAEVGRGGMGVIYRVRDPALERALALKVLAPERSHDEAFRERFRRESRQAAAIEHPNVTHVFAGGEEQGRLYLLMRYVDGPSLAEVLAQRERLPLADTLAIVRQVAAALDAAHATGLVHRDVKPANVLLEGAEDPHAFLCDFGISKLTAARTQLTETGRVIGTVDYVAPELLEGGRFDRRADVYSLACVAFHMLAGEPPFKRETQLATMFAHANAARPALDAGGVPSAVGAVLARAMAVDPRRRHASAGELATALDRAADADAAAPTQLLSRAAGSPRRRRLAATLAVLAALSAAGLAALLLAGGDGDQEDPVAVARVLDVAPRPLGITAGPGRVWVASPASGSVTSIVEQEGVVERRRVVGSEPAGVAVGFGSVWVADRGRDVLLRLEPSSARVLERIPVGAAPRAVAIGSDAVWVANSAERTVSRVDPVDNSEADRIPVGEEPYAIAAGAGSIWVVNRAGASVSVIDPVDSRVEGKPIELGGRPNAIAAGAGSIWVTDNFRGELNRIDPESRRLAGPAIEVGAKPRGVAVGLGYVWVANGEDGTVSRIDPGAGEVVGEDVEVGPQPAAIAAGPGSVWAASYGSATVSELRAADEVGSGSG